MPRGNERISSNVERVVKRGAHTLSKRSPNRNIYSTPSKERSLSIPGLRNFPEQRCTVIWVALEHDSCKIWFPWCVFLQRPEGRKLSGSEADTSLDCLETLKQQNSSPERPDSAESSTASSSSDTSVFGKSLKSNKRNKSVKKISSTSQASTVLSTTSGSVFDGFDIVALGESVNSIPEAEKPVKKSSRKKGKKKKKQHKRSVKKDASVLSQCEEDICHVPVSENLVSRHPASLGECISQNMLEEVTSSGLPVQDTEEDNGAEINNDWRNKSATALTCKSYNDEMHNSELATSLSWDFSGEKLSYDQSGSCESLNQAISSCSTTSSEIILSTSPGNTSNVHPKQNDICETSLGISDDQDSSLEANSFVDKLKTDASGICSDVENCCNAGKKSPVKYKYSCNSSKEELIFNLMENSAPFQVVTADSFDRSSETSSYCSMDSSDWSKYVVDADNTNERVQCSSEASSSDDFIPVVYRKRGRLGRKSSFNSNSLHSSGSANLHGQAGKDNNYPSWQKVQKNGTEGFICVSRNDNVVRQHVDISSEGSEIWERSNKVEERKQNASGAFCSCSYSDEKDVETADIDSIQSSSSEVNSNDLSKAPDGRLLHNSPEQLMRKPSSASNQECQGFMKELQSSKISMEKGVEISPQVINCQQIGIQSTDLCTTEFKSADVMPTNIFESCQSESLQNKQISTLEAQNEIRSVPKESDLLEKTHIKVYSDGGIIDCEDNQRMELGNKSVQSDNSRLNNTSGAVFQKGSHVGRKDSVVFDKDSSEVPIINDPTPDRLQSIKSELPISNFHHLVPSNNGGLPCLSSHSEGAESTCCLLPEVDELTHRFGSHPFAVQKFSVVEGKALSFADIETDLCKIMQAVDESYKWITASEAIRMVTGSPLAEFERFLQSASPIISQRIRSCETCSQDHIIGDALCVHQVPRISLGNFWQWFEKPGSYGLEVMVEDRYRSRRSHSGRSQFRAYFVPYLSSVQLFARSRSSVCFNNGVSNGEAKCKDDKSSKSSCSLESLPIFSMLLPRPRKEVVPSGKDEANCQTINSSNLTDGELLFEYFEADQPQQRRPLFEKIKELVRRDTSCNSQMFGDPSKLECLNLDDLHPASWFSVAWYPIYRIPDGNFRTAFLTYHSLGRFVHRSTESNVISDITQIASPVVGMQSYNAKGECWFDQRGINSNAGQVEKSMSPNPSETLNERLRTLENAASVMARATVRKRNQKSVNRHPDYEFFLSRKR